MSPLPPRSRLLHIDALKALAAQLIVLHHLSAYGPLADAVHGLAPQLMAVFYDYGRMAVQVFLVVGGYLSARGLSPARLPLCGAPAQLLAQRYLRLMLPFFAAVLLTLASSALVACWLPSLVPTSVSAAQLLAHALLLHDLLGYEALTVGAWYVAIDLQLFALLLGLLWLARQVPRARILAPALVLLLTLASLWVFHLDAGLAVWSLHFFGAYGLGPLAHWLSLSQWRGRWLGMLTVLVVAALIHDFRGRSALALATVLLLIWLQHRHASGQPLLRRKRPSAVLAHFGTHSYALFLVHFPICLLVNALFEHKDAAPAWIAVLAMVAAWLLSNLAAVPFHRWIEAPVGRLRPAALLPRALQARFSAPRSWGVPGFAHELSGMGPMR